MLESPWFRFVVLLTGAVAAASFSGCGDGGAKPECVASSDCRTPTACDVAETAVCNAGKCEYTCPAALVGTDVTVCPGATLDLTTHVTGGVPPYTFSVTGGAVVGALDPAGAYVAGAGAPGATSTETVVVTDAKGKTASLTVSVTAALAIVELGTAEVPLSVAPGESVALTITGGCDTAQSFELAAPASGGTVDLAGVYTAGFAGGTTGAVDVVQVTDVGGNTASGWAAVGPVLSTLATSTCPGATLALGGRVSGGLPPYTFALAPSLVATGSSVTPEGQYTAGPGGSGTTSEIVIVTDTVGSTSMLIVSISPALSLSLTSAAVDPRGTVSLTVSGGCSGVTASVTTAASGAAAAVSVTGTTVTYTAGPGGSAPTLDVVTVSDGLTPTPTSVTATFTVGASACTVTPAPGTADGSRLFTATVVTPAQIIPDGQVLVDATGHIACVAADCTSAPGAGAAVRVTCPTGVLAPGLINTHDHITYQGPPPTAGWTERYEHRHDWRVGGSAHDGHTKLANGGTTDATVRWGELRQVMSGTTSVSGSGGQNGLLRNLDKSSTPSTSGSQEGLGEGLAGVDYQTFPLGDSDGTELETGCAYPSIYKASAIPPDSCVVPHVSEGINKAAQNEFLCLSGQADPTIPAILGRHAAIVHGVGLKAADIDTLAKAGTSLIWSPRSNVSLYGDTAKVQVYKRLGANVALGTDWLFSGSMNVLRELACADMLNRDYLGAPFSDQELVSLVTAGAADALQVEESLGRIVVGKVADLALFEAHGRTPYRAIIDATPMDVLLTVRGTKVLYAEASIVDGLGLTGCDRVPAGFTPGCPTVHGAAGDTLAGRRVCLDTSETLATLVAAQPGGQPTYPLAFCGATPTGEPTCTPRRDNSWSTTVFRAPTYPLASGDADGDGIPDAADLCPTVFDPIRPEDCPTGTCTAGDVQADADGDGIGDACDLCPLVNGTSCPPPTCDASDLDGDGVPNELDNCPADPNPGQEALNGHPGRGDACEPCPIASYDAATGVCTTTVYAVKTLGAGGLSVFVNRKVTLTDVLVTALSRDAGGKVTGAFVQAPAGGDLSGIYFFGATTALVGDRVTIAGATVTDYYGQTEVAGGAITVSAQGQTLPAATAVTAAEVATGGSRIAALEGTVVTVTGPLAVTDVAPTPGARDTATGANEYVAGGLRVDDLVWVQSPFPVVGDEISSLTGVLTWRNDLAKLEPRAATDVVWGAAPLVGLGPAGQYTSVGHAAAGGTFPTPVSVSISIPRAVPVDVTVDASSSLLVSGAASATVTIPAGQRSAVVPLSGVTRDAAATLQAHTAIGATLSQTVRVLDYAGGDVPALASVTGPAAALRANGTATLRVSFDLPVSVDTVVPLTWSSVDSLVSPPASVTVLQDALSADVTLTAAATVIPGDVTVSASHGGTIKTGTVSFTLTLPACVPSQVVLSQVYGGGGNSGATYTNDFIELFNQGATDVVLDGWSVQHTSGAGTTWTVTTLTGTIKAGGYYLAQEAAGTGGTTPLPTPDAIGTSAMGASTGKVALVHSTAALTGACPAAADIVGYGVTTCGTPTSALSNTTAAIRAAGGCGTSFTAAAPTPRNTASPVGLCSVACEGP